jgi:membrane-associated phospholipid phosphatase
MLSLLVLAALGAYSRIYLSQHFLSDVCMGSIIGFITPCLIFYFGRKQIMKLKSASLSFFRNFANKSQSYENSSYSSRNALKS